MRRIVLGPEQRHVCKCRDFASNLRRELLALWRELGATWGEVADMLESAQRLPLLCCCHAIIVCRRSHCRCCAGGMKVDDALAQAADKRECQSRLASWTSRSFLQFLRFPRFPACVPPVAEVRASMGFGPGRNSDWQHEGLLEWQTVQDLCTALVAHPALQAKAKLARLLEASGMRLLMMSLSSVVSQPVHQSMHIDTQQVHFRRTCSRQADIAVH